jgi:hypothetical protein
MDQEEFDDILEGLSCSQSKEGAEQYVKRLQELARTAEVYHSRFAELLVVANSNGICIVQIRDIQWTSTDGRYSLYTGIWKQLQRTWAYPPSPVEQLLLEVWQYIVTTPEYDHPIAASSSALDPPFYTQRTCMTYCFVLCYPLLSTFYHY